MQHDSREKGIQLTRTGDGSYVPAASSYHAAPQTATGAEDTVGLGVLMTALWRGKFLIGAAALSGLLIGTVISFTMPRTYRARASVQLEGFNNDQFLREVAAISPSLPNASPDNLLQNAVKLLLSDTLAKRVAEKLGIQPDSRSSRSIARPPNPFRDWVRILRRTPTTAVEQRIRVVRRALTVRTSLQSQVIELFYDSLDPRLAAQGANTAAAEFVELNREARWQLAQDTTDWLNKQASDLKATLEKSNKQLQEFARSTGLVFAGKQNTLAEDRMRQVQDSLARAESDRAAKQARYEAAEANPDALLTDPLAPGPIRQYQTDLENLRRELAQLQTLYTPTNYRVARVQAQIVEAEKSIQRERQNEIARHRTEYLAAAKLEKLLSNTEALQLKTVEQQMANERLYDVKKAEVEATQRLYEAMLQKVKEGGAASALQTTNVRMIDPADPPSVPYSPNSQMNMALGLAIGVIGGVGITLLRAGSDTRVRQPGESSLPEFPELGVIPAAQMGEPLLPGAWRPARLIGASRELTIRAHDRETSLWHESFRATLTSILFSGGYRGRGNPKGGRVLVVTSVDVMEGKTVVVANLGVAAAETKRRVLLIDADLRRPRLHERLELSNERGLIDLLKSSDPARWSSSALSDLVQPTPTPNLWVLPSGPVNGVGSDLLYAYSSSLESIFRHIRKEFDLVLIDTPPLMFCADGRLLGRTSDGLIMVVRANKRRREDLRAAYLQFRRDRIPVLGTILNDWKMASEQIRSYKRYQDHYGPRPS